MLNATTRWVVPFRHDGPVTHRLFCFPHSGAGASVFSGWPKVLPPTVQVCGIQLPGREERLKERPLTDVPTVVTQIVAALQGWQDRPFAFFGHSLGAVLAYEVALRMPTPSSPVHLFVSARLPPSVISTATPIAALSDADFLRELRHRYGGSSEAFWANRELVELYLPILRADVRLAESARFTRNGCLDCPITAFGGTEDDIAPSELRAWQSHTSGRFDLHMIPGDHGLITPARSGLTREIAGVFAEIEATKAESGT